MAHEVVSVLRQLLEIDRSDLAKGFQLAGTDAETFKKRVDRAMTDVEKMLDRPSQAVKRLESAMRGERLMQSANNIAAAIQKVGAASLTDAEAARWHGTIQKAIDKYRLLGKEAPAALIEAERATRKLTVATDAQVHSVDKMADGMKRMGEIGRASYERMASAERASAANVAANQRLLMGMSEAGRAAAGSLTRTSTASTLANRGISVLTGTVGQMAAGFTLANVAMRTFDGVVNLGRQAFETADRLVDMSATTGHSTEFLQRLDFVADQAGGSLESFTNASFQLGVRLTSGRGSVNQAVSELNLNLAELKRTKPDEQFLMIADALARVENEQERNRLGVALFGKTYASVSSAIAQDIRKIGDSTKVMADDQVKALADAKDAWGELWRQIQITSGSIIGGLLPPAADSPGRRRNRAIDQMTNEQRREFAQRSNAGENDDAIISDIQARSGVLAKPPSIEAIRKGFMPRFSLDLTDEVKALDAAVAKLTAEQRKNIDAAFILGDDALEQVKAQYSLTDEILRRYTETQKANAKSTKEVAKETEKLAEAQRRLRDEIFGQADIDEAKELTDALFAEGPVDFSQIDAAQLERIKAATQKAIELLKARGAAIPWAFKAGFDGSARQLGSVLDASALNGLVLESFFDPTATSTGYGDDFMRQRLVLSQAALIARDAEFARGAAGSSALDTSALKDMDLGADGAFHSFRALNSMVVEFNNNWEDIEAIGRRPLETLIQGADILGRSLDQAGLSVSRYLDAVMLASQAGALMAKGGFSKAGFGNLAAGGMMAAGSMMSATSSGPRASRILGGAASGAMSTAAMTGALATTGLKMGAWGGWAGMALGAGIGAAIGFGRSRMVSQDEKDARKAFEAWQKQVIANFEATARQQGRVIDGMDDWEKMVTAVAEAYQATGRSVEDLHHDLAILSDTTRSSAEDVAEALEHINGILNEQAADAQILNDAFAEYGFTLDEIGEKNLNRSQTQEAKRLADQYRVLLDSGVDIAAVHERMSGSISKWLQDTMRTGAVIPSAMRPILENFAKQGQLIDANGLLMDQAAVSALEFKDTWVEGLDRVVVKLDQVLARFAQLLGVPADTLAAAQGSINATPTPTPTQTINGPFGTTFQVPVRHTGGMVERAHRGAFMGSRRMPSSLFGRMAPDEMPMILQAGEGITSAAMTSRMGGRGWIDAVNRGDVTSAIGMMSRNLPLRDPFADMGRLIDMPNRFAGAAATVTPSISPIAMAKGGGEQHFHLTFAANSINIASPNPEMSGKQMRRAVIEGLHTNEDGFRSTIVQKAGGR